MDGLLTPVSTTRRKDVLQDVSTASKPIKTQFAFEPAVSVVPKSAEEALEVLRHQPGFDSLLGVLRMLKQGRFERGTFNIASPSPTGAQIVHVLVTDIAPNYWALLREEAGDQTAGRKDAASRGPITSAQLFLDCVRSLPGLNAILLGLRALTREAKSERKDVKRPGLVANLETTLDLLRATLEGEDCIKGLWTETAVGADTPARRRPLAQEYLALLGSGRVVSYAAEAEDILRITGAKKRGEGANWVVDGAEYSRWLGQNITRWVMREIPLDEAKLCSDLLARSLRLGYEDAVLKILVDALLLGQTAKLTSLNTLVDGLPNSDQQRLVLAALKLLSDSYLNRLGSCESTESTAIIAGAAGVVKAVVGTSETRLAHLVSWLTSSSGAGLGDGIGIRRAVVAVVAQSRDSIIGVLEKSLAQFGEQLYIKHSPMLQQEAHAQVLLLSAGYIQRLSPIKLTMMMRSSLWLNAISQRLAASQERARFLGLVVGEALSGLVETGDKKLDFHMEETNEDEGSWYKGLVNVADQPGAFDALKTHGVKRRLPSASVPGTQARQSQHAAIRPLRPPAQGFVVEEVDQDEGEDDDLVPYANSGSDAEDSDEDATLVRRDKPKAPVYIRDLIRYLRDTGDYDHQKLALTSAPGLIRRKADFGTEVKEHAEELASLLIGLQDKFDIDDFLHLRLQGMIALVVAQPELMGPWFAKTFYDGDYSLAQRASILATLGISARELAGFETSDYAEMSAFPSKTLPEGVERLYIGSSSGYAQLASSSSLKPLPPNALDTVARTLTKQLLAPIAAGAADAVTGPDALKISTFGSQHEQQQSNPPLSAKRKVGSRPRIRAIPNTTAQLLYAAFFSPLIARFHAALRSSTSTRGALIIQQPHLLATYLRTLGIVAHAAGPGTLALRTMTVELWAVLLRARTAGGGDMGVVQAVLFSLLALLHVNEESMRDVCAEMGSEVVETMEWVSDVFERTRGDDGPKGQENEVKMLSAAVLIRLREGVEKYRALLVGDMIGY